jgi:hypothetical protein
VSTIGVTRAAIAAALSTVAGVSGYRYRPTAPRAGDAWTILPSMERQDDIVWRPTWTILIVLPSEERAASDWIDDRFDAIVAALQAAVAGYWPDTAEPAMMATGAGDVYVLQITGRS